MSQKFKDHYENYNRLILKEFMTEKELNDLDVKYSKAKLERMVKKFGMANEYEVIKKK